MPNNKLTLSATTGIATTTNAVVLNNLESLKFNFLSRTIEVVYDAPSNPRNMNASLEGVTTVTYTVASGVATVVIS